MIYNDYVIMPDLSNEASQSIKPLAEFITDKLLSTYRTIKTSNDENERQECQEKISLINASLSMIVLAYLTEIPEITDYAKKLMRET